MATPTAAGIAVVRTVQRHECAACDFGGNQGDTHPLRARCGVDDATPVLQNDLDVRIISPTGTVFQPYSLDLANLWNTTTGLPNPARKDRPNRVDNVEVVDAPSAAGEWKIEVKAFQLKVGEKQSFALAVTQLRELTLSTFAIFVRQTQFSKSTQTYIIFI